MLPASLTTRPHALLLDAGDTVLFVDGEALSQALAQHGESVPGKRLLDSMFAAKRAYQAIVASRLNHEDGWSTLMRTALTECGLSAERAAELLPKLRAIHDEFYFWRSVPTGLVDALLRAKAAGIRLGIISNSEGKLASVLARVGVAEHFELVVDSHLEGVSKPNPEIFRRTLARMQLAPEHSVYAGDIPEVDVFGANAAGMHGVLVDAFDHYPDRTDVARVRSVAQLIDELVQLPQNK